MNQDQVRNALWEAAYNVEGFKQKKANTIKFQVSTQIILTVLTLAGFASLLKDTPANLVTPLHVLGLISGVIGTAILPLLGFQRKAEIFSEWVAMWIEVKNEYCKCYIKKLNDDNVTSKKLDEIVAKAEAIEKDSKSASMYYSDKKAIKQVTKWFKAHGY